MPTVGTGNPGDVDAGQMETVSLGIPWPAKRNHAPSAPGGESFSRSITEALRNGSGRNAESEARTQCMCVCGFVLLPVLPARPSIWPSETFAPFFLSSVTIEPFLI